MGMNTLSKLLISIFLVLTAASVVAEQPQEEAVTFSEGELEQILAPIALYPDTVLSHILVASTYPIEVVQAERWTAKNTELKGSEAVEAVDEKDWDPSVKALVAFPEVLRRLSENLEWTQKVGDAFLQDEERLLASVQSLRQRAYESGNLDKMEKLSVTREENSIVIEPREREIVYVPVYDTRVVYGSWYWSHYPPVYWHSPHYAHNHNPFYWGPSVHISYGFFFSSFRWHDHHLIRIPRHHYRPHIYYSHHQIVSHEHARRWAHNPDHRRGVSYRSVSVSNRYNSPRASRTEIRSHRNDRRDANSRTGTTQRTEVRDNRNSANITRDTRIASPDRIKEELRDGRISIRERGSRPTPAPTNTNSRNDNRETRSNDSNNQRTIETQTRSDRRDQTRTNSTRTQNVSPPKASPSAGSQPTVKTPPPPKPVKSQRESRSKESKSPPRSNRNSSSRRSSEKSSSRKSSSSSSRSNRTRGRDNRN